MTRDGLCGLLGRCDGSGRMKRTLVPGILEVAQIERLQWSQKLAKWGVSHWCKRAGQILSKFRHPLVVRECVAWAAHESVVMVAGESVEISRADKAVGTIGVEAGRAVEEVVISESGTERRIHAHCSAHAHVCSHIVSRVYGSQTYHHLFETRGIRGEVDLFLHDSLQKIMGCGLFDGRQR